jgi:hypothetical protein
MPLPTTSTINKNEVQPDVGANIVLIGAPGSGKLALIY